MNSDQETEPPETCSEEPVHTVKESVEKLFSLINTEFSRPSVPDEEEDFSLLKQICEAKADILKDNPFWSVFDYTTMLIGLAIGRIDWLDAEGPWDSMGNIEMYKVFKKNIRNLKEYNPYWKLDEQDAIKRSACPNCGVVKSISEKEALSKNNPGKQEIDFS
jgi:hypothetical protein